jgi:peptidoglycan/LPS O-acetylase OafA/YrhL
MAMIQAARGAAVFLVMLFHASQIGQQYYGYNFLGISGMGRSGAYTFFFVLTGYIMYSLYWHKFAQGHLFATFLLKRFYRIYPLYWLIMAAIIPVYFMMPSFGLGFERQPSAIFKSLLLWPQTHEPILVVTWSLSFVVLFYIVFSLGFLLKEKVLIAIYSSWATIIVLNLFGLIQLKDRVLIQFVFSQYNLPFIVGIVVAVISRRMPPKLGIGWMGGGIAMYAALWAVRYETTSVPYIDLMHTAGSAMLLVGIAVWQGKNMRGLKLLEVLGNASYSILLASLPAMSILFKLARAARLSEWIGAAGTIAVCFVAALGLCVLFYRWVERPLYQKLRHMLPQPKDKPAGAVVRPSPR